jgi:hypothetical protein
MCHAFDIECDLILTFVFCTSYLKVFKWTIAHDLTVKFVVISIILVQKNTLKNDLQFFRRFDIDLNFKVKNKYQNQDHKFWGMISSLNVANLMYV